MIGVLLFSKKEGNVSPWAAVRGSKRVRITGMSKGDIIQIETEGDTINALQADMDCSMEIPVGAVRLKATHLKVGDSPTVCVDMVI